jgi:hypothetical protein
MCSRTDGSALHVFPPFLHAFAGSSWSTCFTGSLDRFIEWTLLTQIPGNSWPNSLPSHIFFVKLQCAFVPLLIFPTFVCDQWNAHCIAVCWWQSWLVLEQLEHACTWQDCLRLHDTTVVKSNDFCLVVDTAVSICHAKNVPRCLCLVHCALFFSQNIVDKNVAQQTVSWHLFFGPDFPNSRDTRIWLAVWFVISKCAS